MTKELIKAVMLRTRFRHRFWATVNPLFSNKVKSAENILLSGNGKLIKDREQVANILNEFFLNIYGLCFI